MKKRNIFCILGKQSIQRKFKTLLKIKKFLVKSIDWINCKAIVIYII